MRFWIFIICFILLFSCEEPKKKIIVKKNKKSEKIEYQLTKKDSANALLCKEWYDAILKPRAFAGNILIAKNNKIIFEDYASGNDSSLHVNEHTPIHVASTSKTITGMCVLKLCSERKLNIDSAVSHYFPEFNYPGVTIRNLLNHRSGLPNYLFFMEDLKWDKNKKATNHDVLKVLIENKKQLVNEIEIPNNRFNYCNTNYILLALLIEKVTGKKFPDYVREFVFEPLQMNDSYFWEEGCKRPATLSYLGDGKPYELMFLDGTYGDKNMYTTARDLMKWHNALQSNDFIDSSWQKLAYSPTAASTELKNNNNYGLGWRMHFYDNNYKLIYHNGWWHGNNSVFLRMIPENIVIIIQGLKYDETIYSAYKLIEFFNDKIHVDLDAMQKIGKQAK